MSKRIERFTGSSGRSSWNPDDIEKLRAAWTLKKGKMAEIQRSTFPSKTYDDVRNQCVKIGLRDVGKRSQPSSSVNRVSKRKRSTFF